MKKQQILNIVKEELAQIQRLREAAQKPKDLQAAILEFAKLADQIKETSKELNAMKARYAELGETFTETLEAMKDAKNQTLMAEDVVIYVKKLGYSRNTPKYKEAYEWLMERVNPAMKRLAQQGLELNATPNKIKTSLGIKRVKLKEGRIQDKLAKLWQALTNRIRKSTSELADAITDAPIDMN